MTTHHDFKRAMRRMASTVCILSLKEGPRPLGMTVTSVTSLCAEPPSLLVCVNRSSSSFESLQRASIFCINLLSKSHLPISRAFSGEVKGDARFGIGNWSDSAQDGLPYLLGAQANVFCKKGPGMSYGTHMVVVGDVQHVLLNNDKIAPLLYLDGVYCGIRPLDV